MYKLQCVFLPSTIFVNVQFKDRIKKQKKFYRGSLPFDCTTNNVNTINKNIIHEHINRLQLTKVIKGDS